MTGQDDSDRSRRAVLKSAAAGIGVAALANPAQALIFHPVPTPATVMVYRLRTRKTKACNACQIHHRYIVFRSRRRADKNRAHPGCNCPIVCQVISKALFKRLFPGGVQGVAHLKRG